MQNKYDINKINTYTYSLKIKGDNSEVLYKTIELFISNSFYDDENDSIIFSAETVTTLKLELNEVKAALDSVSSDTGSNFILLPIPKDKKDR